MDLKTTYLGFDLRSPLVVAPSPLSASIDNIKRMEDAGAAAIVLCSLFEEQVRNEQSRSGDSLSASQDYRLGVEEYLDLIRRAKLATSIPIIASLNCTSLAGWTDFAHKIERAGADALELNIYFIPSDMDLTAEQIESMYLRILKVVKSLVNIPVAVKLSPFFTNLSNLARSLDQGGADGLVLFNRFSQPDFDPKTLKIRSDILLSTPHESRLPLHWIAILYGHLRADMAASGGISSAEDVIRMLMVGAKVTMIASALLREGIDHLTTLDTDLRAWLDQNDHDSIASLQGSASRFHSKDPSKFERAEYIRGLNAFRSIV